MRSRIYRKKRYSVFAFSVSSVCRMHRDSIAVFFMFAWQFSGCKRKVTQNYA
jgi:hypothetical protein